MRYLRRSLLTVVVSAAVCLLDAGSACAQQLWGEIGLPGGAPAARRLADLGDALRPAAPWLLDFTRKFDSGTLEDATSRVIRYLHVMEDVQTQAGQWPQGVALPVAGAPLADRDREQLERLITSLGLRLVRDRAQVKAEADSSIEAEETRQWLGWAGIDTAKLAADLNFGLRVRVPVAEGALPLPLPAYWAAEVFSRNTLPLVSLLRSRAALRTYVGLMALDHETLAYLAERPRFVKQISDGTSGAFAAFGRSIHVRAGAVDLPGGPSTSPIWESLVGVSAAQPDRFIADLLKLDEGRVAYFYDTVAHVDAPHRQFVLGGHLAADQRLPFVKRVYEIFRQVDAAWSIPAMPMRRPAVDPVLVLSLTDVAEDGRVGPAWWPALLEHVFTAEAWPTRVDDTRRGLSDRPADAAWLLGWILADRSDAPIRFATFRYAQRQFAGVPREQAPAVELALRARAAMPALALSLERMGVDDPALIGALVTTARRLTLSGGFGSAGPRVARWQAALALLEQIHLRADLPRDTLAMLLQSLAALPIKAEDDSGAIAGWVCDRLLPVFPSILDGPPAELERRALGAFAKPRLDSVLTFSWEGLGYATDSSAAVARSAIAVRQSRVGPRLQDLVALVAAARRLDAIQTLEDVKNTAQALSGVKAAVAVLPIRAGTKALIADFDKSVARLNRIARAQDVKKARDERETVIAVLDSVTDAVVPSLAYALAVSPARVPPVFGDTWFQHQLQAIIPGPSESSDWRVTSWLVPYGRVRPRGGTSMTGSFLGLDVALAEAKLVRLPGVTGFPDALIQDVLSETAITRLAALPPPGAALRADAAIADLAAGRQLVERWRQTPPGFAEAERTLRAAGVDEWRANIIAWDLSQDPAHAVQLLTVSEIFHLGGGATVPAVLAPEASPEACFCRFTAAMPSPEVLRGPRVALGALVASDVALRLAEILASLKVPPALVGVLWPVVAQDWLDHVAQAYPTDWEAFAFWPTRLDRDRTEDYLLFLISSGALIPAGLNP